MKAERRRIAIVGSRDYRNLKRVGELIATLDSSLKPILVSGGAVGPDTEAERIALERCWGTEIYRVTSRAYELWGRRAPLLRNQEIAERCNEMWALWNGKSRGTLDVIRQAVIAGKPVHIVPDC